LLGGREWERRLETEIRLRADAPGVGGQLRFEWGPWATAEIETRVFPASERFVDLRLPWRWALSNDVQVAPFLGYSGRLGGVPLGLEARFDRDLWSAKGSAFGILRTEKAEWRLQVDRLFRDGRFYRAYFGAGLVWEHRPSLDERTLYLATGIRI
jgi:hypothetical protein